MYMIEENYTSLSPSALSALIYTRMRRQYSHRIANLSEARFACRCRRSRVDGTRRTCDVTHHAVAETDANKTPPAKTNSKMDSRKAGVRHDHEARPDTHRVRLSCNVTWSTPSCSFVSSSPHIRTWVHDHDTRRVPRTSIISGLSASACGSCPFLHAHAYRIDAVPLPPSPLHP